MRFESLTLEHYGRIKESLPLKFPASPGLVVIFGPNEAGKSSTLEAISDFLYGVPDRSARGQIYGADKIRISASLVRADGTRLSLIRRKGRLRTLTDSSGQTVDEAVLGQILGPTGRDRFASLFGLGHEALRKGGEDLLKAEGEFGRLILDAGGGLRSFVETVDELRAQASELFDARRSKDRLFYKALEAFEEADKAVKQGLVTRERYDKARQQLKAAQDTVAERRKRKLELTEETLRLARLARVVPAIGKYDHLARHLSTFVDVAPLRDDFAADCSRVLDSLKRREEALSEAESRCKTQQAKIDALPAPGAVIDVEAAIRDAGEKAIHAGKARLDRANREAELVKFSEELKSTRVAIGASSDAELEAAAPPANAIKLAQQLAAAGLKRRGKIESIEDELRRERQTRDAIVARQAARAAAGADRPFGVDAADFAILPSLAAAAETRRAQLARIAAEIEAAAGAEGYRSIADFKAWICPDAALIQTEIERRAAIETDLARMRDKIATETEKRDRAGADIERLLTGAAVPSTEAILAARKDRDHVWDEIKARYLDPVGEAVAARLLEGRAADANLKEARTRAADDLADRKSVEAQRVAALDHAQRQKSDAVSDLAAIAERQKILLTQRAEATAAWRGRWPEAAARTDDLERLKRVAAEREELIRRHADWRAQMDALDAQAAEMAPRLEALRQAEAKLNLTAAGSLADRKAAASQAVKAHDDFYADYRQDEAALQGVELKLARIADEHLRLIGSEAEWRALWSPTVKALGLGDHADIERANEIATLWAAAAGHFEAIRVTRTRLKRMDDDEAELLSLAQTIAARVDFPVPQDAVAAAKMLGERLGDALKIMTERKTLGSQLIALDAERDENGRLAGVARAAVEDLCADAGCAPDALAGLAARHEEYTETMRQITALEAQIVQLGDGLSVETLRGQWDGRDLDEIKAAAEQRASEAQDLEAGVEAAVAAQHDREREFDALLSGDGFNAAVAERERAAAQMHGALERYVEIAVAEELLRKAMNQLRDQQKDPLIRRAGELFAASTAGAFAGVETDVDERGLPVVVGRRGGGEAVQVAQMSDGVRDQLYLAFRIASIERHARAAEPLPFIADDLLVHFDDERSAAALGLLAELGKATQVLLFTHHRGLKAAAAPLVARNLATILDLGGA